jgi:hypothetical protein
MNIKCFVSCVKEALKSSPTMHCHVGPYFSSHSLLMTALISRSCLDLRCGVGRRAEALKRGGVGESGTLVQRRGKGRKRWRGGAPHGVQRGLDQLLDLALELAQLIHVRHAASPSCEGGVGSGGVSVSVVVRESGEMPMLQGGARTAYECRGSFFPSCEAATCSWLRGRQRYPCDATCWPDA